MSKKICRTCKINKPLKGFTCHSTTHDRLRHECRECRSHEGKIKIRTIEGKIKMTYQSMRYRVNNRIGKYKTYLGLDILDYQDFYNWTIKSEAFHKLYILWQLRDHPLKLSPSIDRIDGSKGYTLDNMQWITQSENAGKSDNTKTAKRLTKIPWETVLSIRKDYETGEYMQKDLAKIYKCGKTTISDIVNFRTRKRKMF